MIDLHCHSNYSDGALSPELLLEKAVSAGIKTLALTDHDTVAGLPFLHQAAEKSGSSIQIINGIELSTRWKKYDIHILGLNIDSENQALSDLIISQQQCRTERAREIGNLLVTCGVEDAYKKACDIAGYAQVGRPHFATVLLNEGRVRSFQGAFTQFLGRGRPAYVPTRWASIDEAVAGIVAAKGQAVIAHPLKYKLTRSKLSELIMTFKAAGGQGMEVVSGDMMPNQIQDLAGLCTRYDLLASSGSDYHGDELSYTGLGRQRQLPLNCTPIWQLWTI